MASSCDVAKQGVSLLFHLLGSFHSSMFGCTIHANKYKSSTYIGLRHPVIARHVLISFGSCMSACGDLGHTGATYSAIA